MRNIQDILRGLQDRIDSNECVIPIDIMSEWLITLNTTIRDKDEELEFLRSVKENRGKELDEKDAEIERLKEDNRRHCAAIMTTQIYMELESEIERLTQERDAQYDLNVSMVAKHAAQEAEIERLMDRIDGCHQSMQVKDAEIERLWALFSHWYEMWNDGIPNSDGDVLLDTQAALAGKEKT